MFSLWLPFTKTQTLTPDSFPCGVASLLFWLAGYHDNSVTWATCQVGNEDTLMWMIHAASVSECERRKSEKRREWWEEWDILDILDMDEWSSETQKKTVEGEKAPAMEAEVDEDDGTFTNISLADDPGTVGLTRSELIHQKTKPDLLHRQTLVNTVWMRSLFTRTNFEAMSPVRWQQKASKTSVVLLWIGPRWRCVCRQSCAAPTDRATKSYQKSHNRLSHTSDKATSSSRSVWIAVPPHSLSWS